MAYSPVFHGYGSVLNNRYWVKLLQIMIERQVMQ